MVFKLTAQMRPRPNPSTEVLRIYTMNARSDALFRVAIMKPDSGILQHMHFILILVYILSQELMLQSFLRTDPFVCVEFKTAFEEAHC